MDKHRDDRTLGPRWAASPAARRDAGADGSSWAGVIAVLQAAGAKVRAPANPLRGRATDAIYLAGVVAQIPGPVVLVGHSYGGAVIGNAAVHAANVVGLVYVVAAFLTGEDRHPPTARPAVSAPSVFALRDPVQRRRQVLRGWIGRLLPRPPAPAPVLIPVPVPVRVRFGPQPPGDPRLVLGRTGHGPG